MKTLMLVVCVLCLATQSFGQLVESLPPLVDGQAPQTFKELWAPFDPQAEPLDVEILKEWEEDGVVMKVVRFRVGIFKGQKAMMAAVYGYPRGAGVRNQESGVSDQEEGIGQVPGLVQAHGGGQSAHYNACLTNAKRGYATISLAWTGRLHAPGYTVGGGDVKLFWEGDTNSPHYKVTTDWGALDGYHAPGRYGRKFGGVNPDDHTIDPVESPRNCGWYLCALGARRALTFLEQQPEVDGERLGVYGHSMGGQITCYVAGSDRRVKAAAPSCGGFSYRGCKNISEELGWGNSLYLKNVTCPIVFLNPANDFHGRFNFLPTAVSEIKTKDWRITAAPHHNHNDTAPYAVASQLWFDQFLKGSFTWPETPQTEVKLKTASGVPSVTVKADKSKPIQSLHVYYCQQGGENESHMNKMHRFWRSAELTRQGGAWTANLPLYSIDRPIWVYANVQYELAQPVSVSGYYYQDQTARAFNVSSLVELIKPEQLQAAGVKPTIKPTTLIEDFRDNWEDEWFSYNEKRNYWERKTNKLYDPMHKAPAYAKLAFGMSSRQAGTLTVAVDGFSTTFDLDGTGKWQDFALLPVDLVNKDGEGRINWEEIHLLSMSFKPAKGEDAKAPVLRNLRWAEGTREELNARRKVRLDEADVVDGRTYLDIKYADRVRQDIQTNMDRSFGGSPLAIGEKTYERGIGTHANSEILFFLKGKYTRFHAEVGAQKPLPASIRFTVLADGKPLFESGVMMREQGPKVVDVDVTGVAELELVVDDGGNGKYADHANWAEAYVIGQAPAEAPAGGDSLPQLVDGKVPQNLDELWGDYDPASEPLEVRVVREWEEDGIVLRYITYTIGTFKGERSTMSAFYAFPKGEKNLPAMMEIHGGGGKAELDAAKWGAWNGYATLSVNWGGRVPLEDLKDSEPNTDWGAIDATQNHNCHYNSLAPDHLTLDEVESPRNNNWFLLTLGCRRGITFLEQQAEVNPQLIGVTGHSMGGKLTVDVAAIDRRVAVAVPSCGGTGSARDILSGMPGAGMGREESQLLLDTIDDVPYLKLLKCPAMFISPANDFAGPMDNMYINQRYVKSSFFHYAIAPHRNHQHDDEFSVNTLLTFAQFLKKQFKYPQAPELTVNLKTSDGVPEVNLVTDPSKPIEKVDIYYSVDPHALTRFWRDAEAKKEGDSWVAKAPIMSTSHPLFFYANVTYQEDLSNLYMHRTRESYKNRFALSSNMIRLTSDELKAAGVKATDKPERVVEDFSRGWHDWFEKWPESAHHWTAATRKLKDPKYRPPRGAKLRLDVKTEEDNTLVFEFRCNTWGAYPHRPGGNFIAAKEIKGSPEWQTIEVSESDLLPCEFPRRKTDPLPKPQWRYVTEFALKCRGSVIRDGELIDVSRAWRGGREFRNLRWVGGRYPDKIIVSGGAVDISEEDLNSEIEAAIDESWEGTEDFFGEKDYSYAYWKNGWRKSKDDTSPNILCFESGYYGFMLDVAKLAKPKFGRFDDDSNVLSCLEAGTRRMDRLSEAELDINLDIRGNRYSLESCLAGESGQLAFVRMLEAGQVAQHFDIQHLIFKDAEGKRLGCYGDLDMVAWPNSLTFTLKLMPDYAYDDGPSEGVVGSGHCIIEKPLDIPHADEIDTELFTVECWMKTPKSIQATGNFILCKNTHGWQDGNFSFRYWGRYVSAEMNIGGGRENRHSINFGHHRRNEWNHYVLTYDGKEMKVYLNGNLCNTTTIGKKRNPGTGFLRIGQRADGNSGILKGLYDQIRIWNRPLSGGEIKAHAQNPGVMSSRTGLVLEKNFEGGTVEEPDWRDATVRLSFKGDDQAWQVEEQVPGAWKILEEKSFTLNCDLPSAETKTVSIKVTTPDNQSFSVTFDKQMNCFMSTVKGLKRPKDFGQNGGRKYDDFLLEVSNTGSKRETVPFLLNFRDGYGITGNVPILCDENGVPTGIPVQLSKNWHYGAYKLPYVMLPASTGTTRYILRTIYGYYGTLPSASHAQLSLIGYGGNGRWDQLAIGGWGETICFDIGMSLTDRAVTDIRGLMFRNGANGNKWGWTDAGHGADWLGVYDSNDRKLLFNDLKTAYLAHGPCLTDVRYDGYYGAERQVDLKAQIQTLRTDDYMRTFQNLEYGFLKPVSAEKGFFYHLSSRAITPKVVYGNKAGVIADIDVPTTAKTGEMLADHLTLSGEGPWWIAFPGATLGQEAQGGATGCRALIIRSYAAVLGASEESAPTISLSIEDKGDGKKGVACNLVAPKGIMEFKPGDRVRFEMELMTHPRVADDYYGDNQAFIKHLRENPRSWKTIYREARGNDLEVAVTGGTLLKNYPVMIRATTETVAVDIKGGVGYVPIRFENLTSNDYALYEVKQDREVLLDQSIHGNDYWQTNYDAASRRYIMTFNLPLDGKPASKWLLKKIDFGTGSGSSQMTYRDVAYDVHERTKLNFWQAKGEGPRSLVVLIHGGGWLGRDKREVKDVTKFLAKGISVAAINYRYSSIAPLPAPVHDAARAVQFLRYKAADWNIDKNRIVLSGDSAGGCTAVWIACSDDLAKPDSEDPVERESTRIQGAAGAGAQVSVDPKQLEAWVGQQYAHHGMIVSAVGEESTEAMLENYSSHEAIFKEFSAINHLTQDDPPIFLAYNSDLTVPATSYGHAIHHGLFGVKFKEQSEAVGHNKVHLAIGKAYTSQYANPGDFISKVLLK